MLTFLKLIPTSQSPTTAKSLLLKRNRESRLFQSKCISNNEETEIPVSEPRDDHCFHDTIQDLSFFRRPLLFPSIGGYHLILNSFNTKKTHVGRVKQERKVRLQPYLSL